MFESIMSALARDMAIFLLGAQLAPLIAIGWPSDAERICPCVSLSDRGDSVAVRTFFRDSKFIATDIFPLFGVGMEFKSLSFFHHLEETGMAILILRARILPRRIAIRDGLIG